MIYLYYDGQENDKGAAMSISIGGSLLLGIAFGMLIEHVWDLI